MVDSIERGTIVGRAGELAQFDDVLGAVAAGRGRTVVVGGEAGIGKTRLVAAVADRARLVGTTVLSGDCLPTGMGSIPYAPFVEALRRLARAAEPGSLAGLLGPAREELARLIPEVAPRPPVREVVQEPDRSGQGRLFEALLRVLERQAAAGPTVVIVEDIQWADEGTRGLITFLSRNLRESAVLLVLTVRIEDVRAGGPVARWMAELERDPWVERIDLRPLDRQAIALLLANVAGSPVSTEVVEAIAGRSGGNPFFVEQLATSPSEARADRAFPARLRDVLAARLSELPSSTQVVLRAAAAAGRRVDDEVLAVVLGMSPSAIAEALRPALTQRILVDASEAGITGRGYVFHHALLAEMAESELIHGERDRLHAAFASELERRGEVDGVEVAPAEVAYHWVAAGVRDRAVPALIDAGLAAERVYAFAEARRHFEGALGLWPDDPEARAMTGLDRVAVLQHAAETAVLTGAYDGAVAFGRQAIVAADLDDAIKGQPDLARLGALHDRLRWYLWEAGDRSGAEAAVATALRLMPADPPSAVRARALGQAAGLRLFGGAPKEAGDLATEALAVARAAHAPAEAAFALGILGWSTAIGGAVDEGTDLYRQGLSIAEELGGVEGIALGHANLAALLDRVGRTAASLSAARDGFAISERFGVTRTYGGELLGHVAKASFDLGHWDDAAAAADEGLALDPVGPSAIWLHINHARVDSNRGRFAQAESHIRAAGSIAAGADRYRAQLLTANAELGAWQHRLHAVRAIVDDVLAGLDERVPLDPAIGWLAWHALRAEADAAAEARSRHDDTALAEIDGRVSPIVERLVRAASHPAARSDDPRRGAVGALCRGELARIAGEPDPATWDDAASAWDRLERPAPAAYARFRSAEATIRGHGDRAVAATNLRAAHASAIDLGAAPLRVEIEALARHARIDLDVGAPTDRRDSLGLTDREAEVIRLVAAGRSNQQIADELFITRKTASVHVSNILGKLGAANRVEAAAIAQRLGLGETPDR